MSLVQILRLCRSWLAGRMLYAHWGLTHRCNLRCRMCTVRQDARKELPLPELSAAAEALKALGVVYLSLGGGEPFLRDDLEGIVGMLGGKGFRFRVLTNGTLADEGRVRGLAAAGLREVSVSLHSLEPAKHDAIHGAAGVHGGVLKGLEVFAKHLGGRGSILLINTVVSPLNIRELPAIAAFAAGMGYSVSFVPIEDGSCPELAFKPKDQPLIDETYARLAELKRQRGSAILNSTAFLEQSRLHLASRRHVWRCEAGTRYCSVNPEGELSICHRFPPVGSLLNGALREHLRSASYESRRQSLVSACPGCLRPCWAEVTNGFASAAALLEMARRAFYCGGRKTS
ncbi:MAG: radical SAM protein [Elusimicrobia bacterium]|nr:radical SAM protein [Elusimicrobiota bacterium]